MGLFAAQRVDRVGGGGPEGLEADGHKSDQDGSRAGPGEYPPGNGNPIGKTGKPTVHDKQSSGGGDEEGNPDEAKEFHG